MKLAKEFKKIRNSKFLSLADVANKCGITRSTIWKIEQGKLPKGENFELIISKGLGIKKNSATYKKLIGLWTAERLGSHSMSDNALSAKIEMHSDELNDDAQKLLQLMKGLSHDQVQQIKLAIERPKVLGAIETLNELYSD
tara:strand:+ start:9476 stop:9898 length:423 start_codon:yes stop_codon:yes gene_type:complete